MIHPGDVYRSADPRDVENGRPHVRVIQVTPYGAGTADDGCVTVVNATGPERKRRIKLANFHEDERVTAGPFAGRERRSGFVPVQDEGANRGQS